MKYYLKLLSLPLSLLALFLSLNIIWRVFDLPPAEVFAQQVEVWFRSYGLIVLFISAFIEGVLLFGGYFPGVFVIFISIVLSQSIPDAILRVAVASVGLFLAHVFNYALGKYGWHRLLSRFGLKHSIAQAQENLVAHGALAIFSSYWLPSIGTLTDTAAGILQMPFKKFFVASLLSVIFWDSLVGTIVYIIGPKSLAIASSGGITELIIQFSIVAIWIAVLLLLDWKKRRII
ncbi:hypothetical protein C4565_02710 [Candidatus Parcubacteria bacterium]|jgi:membrane protein DedA with SNARE-associated domain|nr:MAG: hypothetical protein C4565_02710 [Candidatus Parcubacteria bacterium]